MISKPKVKKLIDIFIVKELERWYKTITIFDCGPNAKQKDVTKVKEELRRRIDKLTGNTVESNQVSVAEVPEEA